MTERPATTSDRSRIPRAVAAHLGSRDVARVIYGAIIGLALVVALQDHPPAAGQMVAIVLGTAGAVGLAEVYSEFVGTEARSRRHLRRAELRQLSEDAAAVMLGAASPALFFALAAFGVLELDAAFEVAKWSGLALICGYGYLAARLAGSRPAVALLHAAAVGAIGGAVIAIKALFH
jgi:hypothetical protein